MLDKHGLQVHTQDQYDQHGFLLIRSAEFPLFWGEEPHIAPMPMDLFIEIFMRFGDPHFRPHEEDNIKIDDQPCSKNAAKMIRGADELITHLSAEGIHLPKTRWDLSDLGGVHRPWGHWYSAPNSIPFDLDNEGSLALRCCRAHGYRIDLVQGESESLKIVLNNKILAALRQYA